MYMLTRDYNSTPQTTTGRHRLEGSSLPSIPPSEGTLPHELHKTNPISYMEHYFLVPALRNPAGTTSS